LAIHVLYKAFEAMLEKPTEQDDIGPAEQMVM
jgi:hypothetical protein